MSSSFDAKDYQIPSKSKPCTDDHNLSSKDQTSLKSPPQLLRPTEVHPLKDHRLSKNHNQSPPPSQQQLPTRTHPSKDQHILKNLDQPPPPYLQPSTPPSQQSPARARYSNVEQPKKDNHAKLTSRELVSTVHPKSKNYLSQPDRPLPPPPQQQQPPTRVLTSNVEKPDKQPITLAKLTSDEPVTNIYPRNYLLQSDKAPPSQPISPAQTFPSEYQHFLKNSPLPLPLPSPSPSPPAPSRTRPWNVEQPTILTSTETETFYPENYLLQSDGPPPPQPHPLPQSFSPKDQLKNLKPPLARTPNDDQQPENYKQVSNNVNLTNADPVTAYPENFYSQPNGPPAYQPLPPSPPRKTRCPCSCSIL